jgi:hypothetical protein
VLPEGRSTHLDSYSSYSDRGRIQILNARNIKVYAPADADPITSPRYRLIRVLHSTDSSIQSDLSGWPVRAL